MRSRKEIGIAIAAVAVAFLVAIPLGFWFHAKFPAIPDRILGAMLAAVLVIVAFGTLRLMLRQPIFPRRPRFWRSRSRSKASAAYQERKRRRVAELLADPLKAKYAPMVERGELWFDEQIAYADNPNATATCPHLQAVERGMRASGVDCRLIVASWKTETTPLFRVRADCRINEPELRREYFLPESIRYQEGYMPERSAYDNPWAELACTECASSAGIDLVHSEWGRATTKWFPRAPVDPREGVKTAT
jgi:hypothetical protein